MTNPEHKPEPPVRPDPPLHRPLHVAAALAICSGGWLVPGLSHVLLGRWIRGLIFALSILLMFGLGLAMHGKLYDFTLEEPLQIFAFVANIGAGAPYLVAEKLDLGIGTMTMTTYDYGTT